MHLSLAAAISENGNCYIFSSIRWNAVPKHKRQIIRFVSRTISCFCGPECVTHLGTLLSFVRETNIVVFSQYKSDFIMKISSKVLWPFPFDAKLDYQQWVFRIVLPWPSEPMRIASTLLRIIRTMCKTAAFFHLFKILIQAGYFFPPF